MTLQNISLLNGINAKMGFLNKRHELYAQNIANADTPGYTPKEYADPDFGRLLNVRGLQSQSKLKVETTDDLHMPFVRANHMRAAKQRDMYEMSPDNNGVVLEEQLYKASTNQLDYQTMTNLYRRNVGMVRIALDSN